MNTPQKRKVTNNDEFVTPLPKRRKPKRRLKQNKTTSDAEKKQRNLTRMKKIVKTADGKSQEEIENETGESRWVVKK